MQPIIKTQVDIGSTRTIVIDHTKIAFAKFQPMSEGWHYDRGTPGLPSQYRHVPGPDPRTGNYDPAGVRREACLLLWFAGASANDPPNYDIPGKEAETAWASLNVAQSSDDPELSPTLVLLCDPS